MAWTDIKVGDILLGTPIKIKEAYAIFLFDDGITGLLHRKEMPRYERRPFQDCLEVGVFYKVKVVEKDEVKGEMRISLKAMTSEERRHPLPRSLPREENISFKGLENALSIWCKQELEAR